MHCWLSLPWRWWRWCRFWNWIHLRLVFLMRSLYHSLCVMPRAWLLTPIRPRQINWMQRSESCCLSRFQSWPKPFRPSEEVHVPPRQWQSHVGQAPPIWRCSARFKYRKVRSWPSACCYRYRLHLTQNSACRILRRWHLNCKPSLILPLTDCSSVIPKLM